MCDYFMDLYHQRLRGENRDQLIAKADLSGLITSAPLCQALWPTSTDCFPFRIHAIELRTDVTAHSISITASTPTADPSSASGPS